ncbi:MAG: O-antigen ligase family protein [Minisyncoccia bacterium]|jgi:O-antigen ligase
MKLSRADLMKWGTLLFLFALPLGTKKFLFTFPTPFSNFYTSEYNSAFLFGTDILIIALLFLAGRGFFVRLRIWFRQYKLPAIFLLLFLAISLLSVLSAGYGSFVVYSFIHMTLTVLAGLLVAFSLSEYTVSFRSALAAVSISAAFESIVGFLQFVLGKSVGLWFLGETVFDSGTPGIAKITVNGEQLVRAYGTMPHANILAGFLVLGLLALFYLFLREEKPIFKSLEVAGIFVVLAGLFLTFSRSGWITAAIATVLLILWELFADKERRKRVVRLFLVIFVSCLLLLVFLGWAIFPRAALSSGEGPVADRWTYNKIGTELILSHPLGVGIGNELFYAYRNGFFEKYGVNSLGQWQPIHNLYLMVGTETGILGIVSFLVFIVLLVLSGFKEKMFRIISSELRVSLVMLIALLLFGLFDHFLWDLQLGRLMFWVTIGILFGMIQTKNPA